MPLDVYSAVRLSLIVGLCAAALGLAPAVAAGWLLARRTFRGKSLLGALLMVPMVLPPVVTGLLLLRVLGRSAPVGQALAGIGLPVTFTLLGAIVAAGVVGFPLYVASARAALDAVDPRYEELSHTLGVPPWATFRRVTLPLAAPGLAAGAVLAFARGLGEFGATAVLAGNVEGRTRTIALATYTLLDAPGEDPRVGQLALASMALSLASLAGFEALHRWQRRRLGLGG